MVFGTIWSRMMTVYGLVGRFAKTGVDGVVVIGDPPVDRVLQLAGVEGDLDHFIRSHEALGECFAALNFFLVGDAVTAVARCQFD
jgi:hypothetical protein